MNSFTKMISDHTSEGTIYLDKPSGIKRKHE